MWQRRWTQGVMWSRLLFRFRFLVLLATNLTLLHSSRAQFELQYSETQQEVQCRTGQELVLAIAEPKVKVAVLLRDITLTDNDFVGMQSSSPIVIERNLTFRGLDAGWPPVFDMNYLHGKLVLQGSMVMMFRNLFLVNYRRGSATQQPGFDILTAVPDASGRLATIKLQDCYIVYRLCFPQSIGRKAMNTTRPSEVPGTTAYVLPYPSPYTCADNSPPAAAPSVTGNATPGVGDGSPWARYGCFKHVILYADIAVYGGDMKDDMTPAYNSTKYLLHALNTQALCVDVLSDDCIYKYGYIGCLTYTLKLLEMQPPPPPYLPAYTALASTADGTASDEAAATNRPSLGTRRRRSAIVLGCVISGASLLALGATAVFVARRWRRRQFGAASGAAAVAAGSPWSGVLFNRSARRGVEGSKVSVSMGSHYHLDVPPWCLSLELCSATAAPTESQPPQEQLRKQQQQLKAEVVAGTPAAAAPPAADIAAHNQSITTSAASPSADGVDGGGGLAVAPRGYGSDSGALTGQIAPMPCLGMATADDATLLPVTPLTPLQPGINLNVRLGASGDELQLSDVTLGKGAFGRVVAGVYGGMCVAVKLIDHGLFGQWQPAAAAPEPVEAVAHHAGYSGNDRVGPMASVPTSEPHEDSAASADVADASDADDGNGKVAEVGGKPTGLSLRVMHHGLVHVFEGQWLRTPTPPPNAAEESLLCWCAGALVPGVQPPGRLGPPIMEAGGGRSGSTPPPTLPFAAASGGAASGEGDGQSGGNGGGGGAAAAGDGIGGGGGGRHCGAAASDAAALASAAALDALTAAASSAAASDDMLLPLPPAAAAVAASVARVVNMMGCVPAIDLGGAASGAEPVTLMSPTTLFRSASLLRPMVTTTGPSDGGDGSPHPRSGVVTLPPPPPGQEVTVGAAAGAAAVTSVPSPPPLAVASVASQTALVSPRSASLERTLKQEVEILARCQHPNVVRLLAASLRPPRYCLVMERMETSLDRLLYGGYSEQPKSKLLPLDAVLTIAAQIAQGLAYLHPTIIHRDLKPGNVLISRSGSSGLTVKLADFGLSRLRDTVLVTRNPEVGTAQYIAPEAFDVNNNRITDRVDVYALGIILWEMLAGRRPWAGLNIVIIALCVSMYHQRPPMQAVPQERCPQKLRLLIESCWEQIPERRPAAAEVAKRLVLIQGQMTAAVTVGRSSTDQQQA